MYRLTNDECKTVRTFLEKVTNMEIVNIGRLLRIINLTIKYKNDEIQDDLLGWFFEKHGLGNKEKRMFIDGTCKFTIDELKAVRSFIGSLTFDGIVRIGHLLRFIDLSVKYNNDEQKDELLGICAAPKWVGCGWTKLDNSRRKNKIKHSISSSGRFIFSKADLLDWLAKETDLA